MIRIGICGYGNLGRGVESSIQKASDMELVAVFSRRNPSDLKINTKTANVCHVDELENYVGKIDVLIICGGSATDLPVQTPKYANMFNVIDSFDTHAKINEHFNNVDKECKKNNTVGVISVGWDPGMFSLNRLYAEAILPQGDTFTFWGKGVSQGHSDAIRRIDGVLDAKQYTIPKEEALTKVRSKEKIVLSTRDKHLRECFVVLKDGANSDLIEKTIKEMPNYFSDYDTIVNFISLDEFKKNHSGIAHGGFVIRTGETGFNNENKHIIEYNIKLDSNPEFTSNVMVSYARAAYRLSKEQKYGCYTVFDIAPKYIASKTQEALMNSIL